MDAKKMRYKENVTKITKTHPMERLDSHPFFPIVIINNARIGLLLKYIGDVDNKIIADIGCESGLTLSSIQKMWNPKKIYAVDLSSYAIKKARLRASREGWAGKTRFVESDAEKISLPDNSIDVVISSNVLEHLKSPQKGFNELVRITKKGGKIIVHVPNEKKIIACKKFLKGISPRLLGHLKIVTPGHLHYPDRRFLDNIVKDCPYKLRILSLRTGPAVSIIGLYLYMVVQKL